MFSMRIRQFFFFLTLIFSGNLYANQERLIVVTEHLPPYQVFDEQDAKNIDGYSIEILRATLDNADIEYEIMPMTWHRAYNLALKKPNVIILSMVKNTERQNKFHWLISLSKEYDNLWSHQDHETNIQSLSDITNELIAVNKQDHLQLILKRYPNITDKNLIITTSKQQTLNLVAKRRAQYFLANEKFLNWRLKENPTHKNIFKKVITLADYRNELFIASNIGMPEKIRQDIQRSYQEIKARGEVKSIAKKWF